MRAWWVMVAVTGLDVSPPESGVELRGYYTSGFLIAPDLAELEHRAVRLAARHYETNALAALDLNRSPVFTLEQWAEWRWAPWWLWRLRRRHALLRGGSWWSHEGEEDEAGIIEHEAAATAVSALEPPTR